MATMFMAAACGGTTCGSESTEKAPAEVYLIREINPQNLVRIYEALGRKATGRVAVKLSTGEPGGHHFLQPALIAPLVRQIEGQERRADHDPVRLDPADVKLKFPAAALRTDLAASLFQRRLNGEIEVMIPVYRQEALSMAGGLHTEDPPRRRIDAQNFPGAVQQYQPLLHMAGDLLKLVCLLLQIPELV